MEFGSGLELSALQKQRIQYKPDLPQCLQGSNVQIEYGDATTITNPLDAQSIRRSTFPLTYGKPLIHFVSSTNTSSLNGHATKEQSPIRVGIVFCGRQSPGGHNDVCGFYDAIKSHNAKSTLIGFCERAADGPTTGSSGGTLTRRRREAFPAKSGARRGRGERQQQWVRFFWRSGGTFRCYRRAVLVNTNQFYKWFSELESAMKSETKEKYDLYVNTLVERIEICGRNSQFIR